MKLSKKLLIVNLCGIVGAMLSILVVPDSFKFWLWVGIVIVVLCSLNLFVIIRTRRGAGAVGKAGNGISYLIIGLILACVAVLLQFGLR